MSLNQLQELGQDLISIARHSPICARLAESALQNMRDSICERNDELNDNLNVNDNAGAIFNEYDDVLPPQIQQNAPKPPQAPVMPMQPPVQPPIIGQTLIPPVMGASANSYISAANQVPFLFHNQQIRQ